MNRQRFTAAISAALAVALDYQKHHPNTLIVVTADHSHTSQIVSEDTGGSGLPAASPPSQQHTGAVVPVWGKGPGSLRVLGTNDHIGLFETLGG